MLLKCCVIILILFLKIIFLCDGKEFEGKNNSNSETGNHSKLVCTYINGTRNLRKNEDTKKPTMEPNLLLHPNATANTMKIEGHDKRFLTRHFAVTCDGYILEIFRLTFEQNKAHTKNRPVLLVTGMFQSSDRFLKQTENQSLAFRLQDLGYDVWLGNARGNKYSRFHIYLEPESEKKQFFNYGFEEIGFYDIAAIVDFIRNVTDSKKIHYIGHSLGGTAFLILNSMKPEYNAFFDRAYLLAPLAYQRYFPNNELKRDIYHLEKTYEDLSKAGSLEIFPYNLTQENVPFFPGDCLGDQKYANICNLLAIQKIMGLSRNKNTWENTRGGSIKQLVHLAQNIHSGTFSRWFYKDEKDNLKNYGRKSPPEYDLSLVTVPTTIFYSAADEYVARRDIEALAKKMGKATTKKVAKKNFKHDDFISAPDVVLHVYSNIVDKLPENPNAGSSLKIGTQNAKTPFKFFPTGLMMLVLGGGASIFFCVRVVKKLNKSEQEQTEDMRTTGTSNQQMGSGYQSPTN